MMMGLLKTKARPTIPKAVFLKLLIILFVITSLQVNAANLIIEDFETPDVADNTVTPAFTGWTWVNNVKSQDSPGDGVPGTSNQVLHFEYTSYEAYIDIDHAWGAGNTYVLTLKASPQSWNGDQDRYIAPSLRQQDGTVLWSANDMMPKYDNFGGNPWTAAQTFTWVIQSDDFVTGTAGSNLRLQLDHTGFRGVFIDDVELVEGALAVDNTPPSPDPMGWITAPTVVDFINVTMTSNLAIDEPYGVQYLFENITTGANSGWQSNVLSNTWAQANLVAGNTYTYRVKARDMSPNLNETAWSNSGGNVTMDPPDVTAPTPNPMTWATSPMVLDDLIIYMVASTATDPYLGVEYFFENVTTGANSGWLSVTYWHEMCKPFETQYTYRVKSRDLSPNSNETSWTTSGGNVTIPTPNEGSRLLVSGNFQLPVYTNGYVNPVFSNWTISTGQKSRIGIADGLPGGASNQVIHFEQTSYYITYDICDNWTRNDIYTLTLNAAPQDWSGASTRYVVPSLLQQDGTVLWTETTLMPVANSFGGNPWTTDCTFTYTIKASDFSSGTSGEPLRLKIGSSGQRGIYVDNVKLTKNPSKGTIIKFN